MRRPSDDAELPGLYGIGMRGKTDHWKVKNGWGVHCGMSAELTPDAGVGACPFVPFVPQTPFTWSASPEDLRDAALLREAWGVVVPVRTPPRLDVLES